MDVNCSGYSGPQPGGAAHFFCPVLVGSGQCRVGESGSKLRSSSRMLHSREGIILGSSAIPPANQGMGAPIFSAIHSNASGLSGFSRINDP